MLPQEIIRRKRDGHRLSAEEIAAFVGGLTSGAVSEGQAAAFAMAVFFEGMSREEAVALTLAMRSSGAVLDWSDLPGPVTDKHSTGGVGDNVSLMLAPIVAACGAYVPMISGRGLGHTGGTLDKMDSIPGYVSQPNLDLFRRTVLNEEELAKEFLDKTPNWDTERIAEIDTIILKMGICEFLKFPSIPVKVTINEYLEIAKEYSTPKSSIFINGILDNLVKEFTEKKRLNKTGRGDVPVPDCSALR